MSAVVRAVHFMEYVSALWRSKTPEGPASSTSPPLIFKDAVALGDVDGDGVR